MAELTKKKKVRSAHKGAATRLIGKVREKLNQETFNYKQERPWVHQSIANLSDKIECLRTLTDEMVDLMVGQEEECDGEELESVIQEGDDLKAELHTGIRSMES